MALQGLKASGLAALLGMAAFLGSPCGASASGSSDADVMAAYGISASSTLTPAQVEQKITNILNNKTGGTGVGGAAGVAAFVAALVATAGASTSLRSSDATAFNIVTALLNVGEKNPALSGAIAGGMKAAMESLTYSKIGVSAGFFATANGATRAVTTVANVNRSAIVGTNLVTVVQPSPSQTCSGGSCN